MIADLTQQERDLTLLRVDLMNLSARASELNQQLSSGAHERRRAMRNELYQLSTQIGDLRSQIALAEIQCCIARGEHPSEAECAKILRALVRRIKADAKESSCPISPDTYAVIGVAEVALGNKTFVSDLQGTKRDHFGSDRNLNRAISKIVERAK